MAFIRHGERADFVAEEYEYDVPHDPILTPVGVQQAAETGKFLADYLKENKYDEVILESSPFIRTLMTAAQIAKALNISQIKVNYRYSEWLDGSFYAENPIPTLEIKIKEKEVI